MSKKNDNDSDSLSAFTDSASQAQMSQSSSSNSITNQQASNSTPSAVKPASSVQSTPNPMASFNAVNISNVFKQIYNMKYLQRSSAIQSPANAGNQSPAATLDSPTTLNTGSDLRQFWMPDDQVKECYECNEKFTTFRRRHVSFGLFDFVEHIVLWKIKFFYLKKKHCRVCGQIFCSKCSDHEVPSQIGELLFAIAILWLIYWKWFLWIN